MWAETKLDDGDVPAVIISIHSARVGGDDEYQERLKALIISIHSARVGGDDNDVF